MLPDDIILYIHEFKHNLYMLDLKEELFYGVMKNVIKNFTKMTDIIYYIIVSANSQEVANYLKLLNEYYKTYCKFIDYFCYKYRYTHKLQIKKIMEALNIINCYYNY